MNEAIKKIDSLIIQDLGSFPVEPLDTQITAVVAEFKNLCVDVMVEGTRAYQDNTVKILGMAENEVNAQQVCVLYVLYY